MQVLQILQYCNIKMIYVCILYMNSANMNMIIVQRFMYKQFYIILILYKLHINSISYSKFLQFLMDINIENGDDDEISNITTEAVNIM